MPAITKLYFEYSPAQRASRNSLYGKTVKPSNDRARFSRAYTYIPFQVLFFSEGLQRFQIVGRYILFCFHFNGCMIAEDKIHFEIPKPNARSSSGSPEI